MNKQQTWNHIKSVLFMHEKISNDLYRDYFADAMIVHLTKERCVIQVANSFVEEIFQGVKKLIEDIFVQDLQVKLHVSFLVQHAVPVNAVPKNKTKQPNERQTFANYILGVTNQDAYNAVHETIQHPGVRFNPLFISGYPGVGKTHLLKATYHFLKEKKPTCQAYYLTSEEFCNKVISALQESSVALEAYKNSLKVFDVILVDDIQFLKNKRKTNEIFFHLVDYWIENHQQIVISSDKKLTELKGFAERLISRFANGLNLTLRRPDLTTMVKILKHNLQNQDHGHSLVLDDKLLFYLAKNAHGDIRALKGHLNKVLFKIIVEKIDPAQMSVAQMTLLLENESGDWNKEIVLKLIKTKVATYYDLTLYQLMSNSRSKTIVQGRNLTFYLINRLMNYSFLNIAQLFNRKDHSIVVRGCKKIANQLKVDSLLKQQVNAWEEEIKANMVK